MERLLAAVAVIGPWRTIARVANTEEATNTILEEAHKFSEETYGEGNYYWITMAIQTGFGRFVTNYCRLKDIRLISIDAIPIHFLPAVNGERVPFGNSEDLGAIFRSRHASVIELADCFFIKNTFRPTIIDDLIFRVKKSDKPYFIYSEENTILEYKGDPKKHNARKAER